VDHRGLVRRAGLLDERVWVLSDVAVQSVDIDDLDEPVSLSTLDIIDEQELLDAGLLNCMDSARFRGTDIDWMFVDSCGSIDWLTLFLMGMGMCAMRVVKGRP
jgi:hypothetical protein